MDWQTLITELVINLCITAIAYLFVPTILCLRRKKYTKPKIKKIVIINGIIVCLIFMVIRASFGESGASGAVFLWSAIAYWLMRNKCLIEEKSDNTASMSSTSSFDKGSVYGSDIALKKENQTVNESSMRDKTYATSREYSTSINAGVGDKYGSSRSTKSPRIRILPLILTVAIMLSIGANVHQFQQIQSLTETKNKQETEISKLERQLEDVKDSRSIWIDKYENAMVYKEYMDQHIVFLPNDASYIYHKFDCWVIEGKTCYIYNVELAQSYGYKACSLCH